MTTDLIDWARGEWCEREYLREIDSDGEQMYVPAIATCPAEVVAALLDLLTEAAADGTSRRETHTATLRALNKIREARLVCLP